MHNGILKTMTESIAMLLVASTLSICASSAIAQSKPGSPAPGETGAERCEYSKGHVETLKSMLKNNSGKWSAAMRTSVERDIAASEKETAACCNDLAQCARAYEASAAKGAAK